MPQAFCMRFFGWVCLCGRRFSALFALDERRMDETVVGAAYGADRLRTQRESAAAMAAVSPGQQRRCGGRNGFGRLRNTAVSAFSVRGDIFDLLSAAGCQLSGQRPCRCAGLSHSGDRGAGRKPGVIYRPLGQRMYPFRSPKRRGGADRGGESAAASFRGEKACFLWFITD